MGEPEGVGLTTSGSKMSGEGSEKVAVTSYSLKVLLAAMLGGGRDGDKPVPARLLTDFVVILHITGSHLSLLTIMDLMCQVFFVMKTKTILLLNKLPLNLHNLNCLKKYS